MTKRPKPQAAPADVFGAVRDKLAAGRTMAALKDAKELAKRQAGPQAEALLADAYRARIQDLARQGHADEARDLLAVATARFPNDAAAWQSVAVNAARAAGDLSDLLRAWRQASDDATKQQLGDELRRVVTDPQQIASSSELAADDPLRVAAVAVDAAFRAAAGGGLDDAAREGLRAVGRRSPLVGWRHLALALDAFHQHDDAACRASLEQIRADDSVAPARDLLLTLLAVEPPTAPRARTVALRVTDGLVEIYAPTRTLERGELRERREAARVVLDGLAARSARAAARFVGWLRQHKDLDPLIADLDGKGLGDKLFGQNEWLRLTADLDVASDPVAGLITWLAWLTPVRGKDLRPLPDLDLGELMQHLAPTLLQTVDRIAELLPGEFIDALGDAAEMDAVIERHMERHHPTSEQDRAITAASFVAHCLSRMRRRAGFTSRLPGAFAWFEYAMVFEPSAQRGSELFAVLREYGLAVTRPFLVRWREMRPQDAEPLLEAATLEEHAGAYEQALQLIGEAEARDAVDERVRGARVRLRFKAALAAHRRGDAAAARELLDLLVGDASAQAPLQRTAVAALRGAAFGDEAALATHVADPATRAQVLELARGALAGPLAGQGGVVQPSGESQSARLAKLAYLVRIAQAAQIQLGVFAPWVGAVTSDDLPAGEADRHALCLFAEATDHDQLLAVAAGAGLAHDGPLLAAFLMFKAQAVASASTEPERVLALAKLAHHHAQRGGQHELARAARELFAHHARQLPESAPEESFQVTLEPAAAHALLLEQRQRESGVRTYVARRDESTSADPAPSSSS